MDNERDIELVKAGVLAKYTAVRDSGHYPSGADLPDVDYAAIAATVPAQSARLDPARSGEAVLSDDELVQLSTYVAIREVTREDSSRDICIKQGRAIIRAMQLKQPAPDGEAVAWPQGYCRDPNGKIIPPEGKYEDFNFGYEMGFSEGMRIQNNAAKKTAVPCNLLYRLQHHVEDKSNTAFARSTMRELLQLLTEHAAQQPAPDGEAVAWVEVVDSYEGPYNFHGLKLLPVGKHQLYTRPAPVNQLVEALCEITADYADRFDLDSPSTNPGIKCVIEQARSALAAAGGAAQEPVNQLVESKAAQDVLAERRRQVEAEGWTPEHDDEHDQHMLATAGACYALYWMNESGKPLPIWPWQASWWKPSADPRRNLVKAGALLLAEIERIDRAALAAAGKESA